MATIKGVPKVWISMTKQSYTGVKHERRADGSLKWMHKVLDGYDANKVEVWKEKEDVGHKDPKSYLRTQGEMTIVGRQPIHIHADIAAGLIASQQAEWVYDRNEADGNDFGKIMEQFCPEHLKQDYADLIEAVA